MASSAAHGVQESGQFPHAPGEGACGTRVSFSIALMAQECTSQNTPKTEEGGGRCKNRKLEQISVCGCAAKQELACAHRVRITPTLYWPVAARVGV